MGVPVKLFTIRTSAVARRLVDFRWEATALKSCVDVAFLLRLRSEQSLKHAVVVLQKSMRNFVEHSENITKCGAVVHITSSFGCRCID